MHRPLLALLPLLALVACRPNADPSATAAPSVGVAKSQSAVTKSDVGTDPGGISKGPPVAQPGHALAAFAGGCFWGVEDMFRQVPGVTATAVGYTGGKTKNPTYREVCSHTTGHAEAVLVEFDPAKVTYEQLLTLFFANHDPTTINRQGPDVGDQYRSEVFTFGDAQADAVRAAIGREQAKRSRPVVTRISPLGSFYLAEDYHQQYDEKTGTHSCPIGLSKGT